MTKFLSIDLVLAIQEKMIKKYGGRLDVHDFTLLHSAIERPRATFGTKDLYKSIFDKAASIIQSLILNHPFADGNKRTALTSCALFLHMNGFTLVLTDEETIQFTLDIDSHKLTFEQTATWLEQHAQKVS